jgi:hypothetical protein
MASMSFALTEVARQTDEHTQRNLTFDGDGGY